MYGENQIGATIYYYLPTEEIFTAPLKTGVDGTVKASKPILYKGKVIDEASLEFKDGKIKSFSAKSNEAILAKMFIENENSDYLGEVALVSQTSAISKSGIFWYDTSFDENSGCHLAFGNGYLDCLKNVDETSEQDKNKVGLNSSSIHLDFIIGTPDICVVGITGGNEKVNIIFDGEWCI